MNALKKCILCVDTETPDNRIFTCQKCKLSVHFLCYGISETVDIDDWLCSPCISKPFETVLCELCCQSGGALKKTSCSKWAHVLCALFTEGTTFEDLNQMEPIDISQISPSKWNQMCAFCSKAVGCSPLCSKSKCERRIHITCAQTNNCLKEVTNRKDDSLKFRAYCIQHKPVDSKRRLSGGFVKGMLAKKGNNELKQQKDKSLEANLAWIMNAVDEKKSPRQKLLEKIHESNEKESKTDENRKHDEKVEKRATKRDHPKSNDGLSADKEKKKRKHAKTDPSTEFIMENESSVSIDASEKSDLSAHRKKKKKEKRHLNQIDPSSEATRIEPVSITSHFAQIEGHSAANNGKESRKRAIEKRNGQQSCLDDDQGRFENDKFFILTSKINTGFSLFKEERRHEDYMWWDEHDVFAGQNGLLPEKENKENFIEHWHACYKDHDIIMVINKTIVLLDQVDLCQINLEFT